MGNFEYCKIRVTVINLTTQQDRYIKIYDRDRIKFIRFLIHISESIPL